MIHRIGEVVSEYQLPTNSTTAPAFGGPDGDVLIVGSGTRACDFNRQVALPMLPAPAGSVYMIRGFARGNLPRLPRFD